jgi:hypothetical protein
VASGGFGDPHEAIVVLHRMPDPSTSGDLVLPLLKGLAIDGGSRPLAAPWFNQDSAQILNER